MFTRIALIAAIVSTLLTAQADPTPTEPGPGDVFNEGAQCHIAWTADTTGVWTTMSIELMTGDNINMVNLTTVATVDGTDPTKTTLDITCPEVTPNSAIYFYQFSTTANSTKLWTTRFAIADASGNTTPPPQTTQPSGQSIPWGAGKLSDPSDATPPSSAPGSSAPPASVSIPASSASSSPATLSPATLSPPASLLPPSLVSSSLVSARPSATTNSTPSVAGNTDASNTNGAVSLGSRVLQTLVALGTTAFAFAIVL